MAQRARSVRSAPPDSTKLSWNWRGKQKTASAARMVCERNNGAVKSVVNNACAAGATEAACIKPPKSPKFSAVIPMATAAKANSLKPDSTASDNIKPRWCSRRFRRPVPKATAKMVMSSVAIRAGVPVPT